MVQLQKAKTMSGDSKIQKSGMVTASEFLTAEEVGKRLRLPLSTVYHLARSGALPAIQLGRTWRFPSRDIDELAGKKPVPGRILVVGPDVVAREFAVGLLKPRGHLILEAPDAESGLEAARQEAFDVLVIDFHLPGNDGAEFVRELRIEYSLSQIIMVVASPDLAQMNKLFDLGVFALLRKPLDASQLVGSVERILRARQRLTL